MSRFQFDCKLCETNSRTTSERAIKEQGARHLEDDHYEELTTEFARSRVGEPCGDDCGYVYPVGVKEVAGFDCPNCGHDHCPSFVTRYLYWRMERDSSTGE